MPLFDQQFPEHYGRFCDLALALKKLFDAQDRFDSCSDDQAYKVLVERKKTAQTLLDDYIAKLPKGTSCQI